jgi:hypothetical protein
MPTDHDQLLADVRTVFGQGTSVFFPGAAQDSSIIKDVQLWHVLGWDKDQIHAAIRRLIEAGRDNG